MSKLHTYVEIIVFNFYIIMNEIKLFVVYFKLYPVIYINCKLTVKSNNS